MDFQFKKFTLNHSQSTMKVGTDAILLASWADVERDETILDVGTGCGVIAIMLAQRNQKASIQAIDIDPHSISEAKLNMKRSPWSSRLQAQHVSFQSFEQTKSGEYDHIISNPPFFDGDKRSVYPSRTKSRHTVYLGHDEFMQLSASMSKQSSRISIILPQLISDYFLELAELNELYISRKTYVKHARNYPVTRVLMEFSKRPVNCLENQLILYDSANARSEDFRALTSEFYL